jgi:hypothetical protein
MQRGNGMSWLETNVPESQRWGHERLASFEGGPGVGVSREGHYYVWLGGNIEEDEEAQELLCDLEMEMEEEGYFMAGLVSDVDKWIMVLDWTVEDACNVRGEPLHQVSEERADKIRRLERKKIASIVARIL